MAEVEEKVQYTCGDSDRYDDPTDKLWSIYVAKVEKYDKALVESWKGDMDGILIFAGLFSASVAAFILEGYKKLSPDSGDMTVALLTQISFQLVAISNGSSLSVPSPPPAHVSFHTTSSAVVVNILWFLSLKFGLVCALSATMVEQWARNYLHLVEFRTASSERARVRAYLYEGIDRFRMRDVVDAVPTLLHVSLILFIIGLVIFLFPISLPVALMMLIVLSAVVVLYATVTFLPIRHKNCPYHTPLSQTCWKIMQHFHLLRYCNYYRDSPLRTNPIPGTISEGRTLVAMLPSPKRSQRDLEALIYTLNSATNSSELEQFLGAIPVFYRHPWRNIDRVLKELALLVFKRSEPILDECLLRTNVHGPTRRRRAVRCIAALQAVAPKLPEIPMINFLTWWDNMLLPLQMDSDTTIATLAMCMNASLISSFLFYLAESIPAKSKVGDSDAADEQLLVKISDELPIDEWRTMPIELSAEATRDALRILNSDGVMDAAKRYLKRCRASALLNSNGLHPTHREICNMNFLQQFFPGKLARSVDWIDRITICEAEISVQYLQNPNRVANGWSNDRALSAMSTMLGSLRTKMMREEFWNCGRMAIANTLLSQLVQCKHDTREHSAFILETIQQLFGSDVSPNDADLETQTKFIHHVKEAASPSPKIPPLAFPVVESLLKICEKLEHPKSILLTINAMEGNEWLLHNNFPLESTLQRLKVKLSHWQEADTVP